MDLVVVYRADAEAVAAVMEVLRRDGLHPMALGADGACWPVPIAVPPPEAPAGRRILSAWHAAPAGALDRRVRQCQWQLAAPLAVTVAAAVAMPLACGSWLAVLCCAVALVWLAAQVVLADIQEILEL